MAMRRWVVTSPPSPKSIPDSTAQRAGTGRVAMLLDHALDKMAQPYRFLRSAPPAIPGSS